MSICMCEHSVCRSRLHGNTLSLFPSLQTLGGAPTYCCFHGGVGYLGHQAVSELDPRVFGGDRQTFLQNFHQADPELKHGLWMFLVEPQVVDLLGHCPNPKDALGVVIDL